MELKEVRTFLEALNQDEIIFDPHFYKRTSERPINEGMIRKYLASIDKFEKAEYGKDKGNRLKLWFRMSRKYSLVMIVDVLPKGLKVISAWNTNIKWQGKLKR
ncbi:hypothetical protein KW805_03255 [Candidatus Pacearchaeota archaeon]|nr:hypothetical protein [Candidatus Pacearchaeota archaeon]